MAKADCELCEAVGYRSCDLCGTPVFHPIAGARYDLCAYCEHLTEVEVTEQLAKGA